MIASMLLMLNKGWNSITTIRVFVDVYTQLPICEEYDIINLTVGLILTVYYLLYY